MTHTAPYWIQRADLSAEEFPSASAIEIEKALQSFDWAGEAMREQQLIASETPDCCPAGLGVVHEDGRMLIIRPDGDARCAVEYSFFDQGKAFGFLPKRKYHAGMLENVPIATAARLIAPFLANDYAAVKHEIEALK